ncbi:MAG TPA: hypothetical protein VNE62_08320 [Actinomycetota bacterium]|nr:hypothetical protein [Actinomycetota bacterium]
MSFEVLRKVRRAALALSMLTGLAHVSVSTAAGPRNGLGLLTGNGELFIAGRDGSDPRRLASGVTAADSSPRGDRIVIASRGGLRLAYADTGRGHELWTFQTASATCRTIACPEAVTAAYDPAWSPTDDRIAFAAGAGTGDPAGRGDGGASWRTKIFTISSGGTGLTPLTAAPSGEAEPAWSPDGSSIAFTSFSDGEFSILVATPGSATPPGRVSPAGIMASAPVWSPTGGHVAFLGNGCNLYVVNADGSESRQVSNESMCVRGGVSWSPDGSLLALASSGARGGGAGIYVAAADGSSHRQLTSEDDSAPSWSPDGSSIAFVRTGVAHDGVYAISPDGGSLRAIAENHVGTPFWT